MTRYARAKGSKASNERVEEEATPWEQLRGQIAPPSKNNVGVEDLDDEDIGYANDENETVGDQSESEESEEEVEEKSNVLEEIPEKSGKKKRKRNQNKCLNCKEPGHLKKDCPQLSEERRKELQELVQMKIERKGKGTGRKKNKKRKLEEVLVKEVKEEPDNDNNTPKKKRRKQLKDKTGQLVQEGEGLFQGFRVLEEDVQRLRDLHNKLDKEKASPEEIKEVLKRERRKAEKALANSKKNVCYHCRETGHRLNECPKKSEKIGKCFKCGSHEHTSKNCESKLKGAEAYRFADCFVCGQTGHLAKACPDNPKGLYPKGGGCRFCGSVEHLKSECPRKAAKDAKSHVVAKRQTSNDNIEDEDDLSYEKRKKFDMKKKKQPKVVSF